MANQHVGKYKDRLSFTATIIDRERYRAEVLIGGGDEYIFMTVLRTDDGDILRHHGKGYMSVVPRGARITFNATVQDHRTWMGEKQTIVNRPGSIREVGQMSFAFMGTTLKENR